MPKYTVQFVKSMLDIQTIRFIKGNHLVTIYLIFNRYKKQSN